MRITITDKWGHPVVIETERCPECLRPCDLRFGCHACGWKLDPGRDEAPRL